MKLLQKKNDNNNCINHLYGHSATQHKQHITTNTQTADRHIQAELTTGNTTNTTRLTHERTQRKHMRLYISFCRNSK